jgi:hypothetical protein
MEGGMILPREMGSCGKEKERDLRMREDKK